MVLADDEALLRRGLKVLLEADGRVEVVGEAADGAELVEVALAHLPDVVLVDVQMPGVDGLEAVRRLRTWATPPAIAVLTTFDLNDYVATALDLGAQGFLLKDAEPDTLVRAVVDLAAGGAVLDPRITARLLPRLRGFRANRQLDKLSARERQVLELVAGGRSNHAIAEALCLSEATVKSYVSTVLTKLGVENRVQAALVAHQVGDW
ncbi:DNA-binding response regulator, NarL/FixJ family, contains REC and HTH domains [Lentzea fradiae]|uniref:DNA-binding response regulator, NarL/FixJ family, contains REC and HTH domains n=1 Tax=Lentzea fradiae TaxID=200378 RepID=A0A1G7XLK0_9PSEU|nr:response regulator transcription factor [Lentzea fradiae]SDG84946.1 DNA-binding response regulator, NarL/FixJ family, contains REC and HTH domains [Lentzea fradiae]